MTVTGALVVVAVVVAINPARIVRAAGGAPEGADVRPAVAGGVALVAAGVVALAALGSSVWRGLDVSDPTGVLAAGLVLVLAGAWTAVVRRPEWAPALAGMRGALVPVAVPLGLRPEVGMVALAAGADGHVPAAALGAVVAGAATIAGSRRPSSGAVARAVEWVARGTGLVAVAVGIAFAVAGVYSV